MKKGVELESTAAMLYSEVTGNRVLPCGFVVNPNAPHLGTSPDRMVIERGESVKYGLLEIKCVLKQTFKDYLKRQADGGYKLKEIHTHHYQIMGQLGLVYILMQKSGVK